MGDGDFLSLVEAMQRRGVRVTAVSAISIQPPMIADELRRQAVIFIDLAELQSKLGRDPSQRATVREPILAKRPDVMSIVMETASIESNLPFRVA